MIRPLWLGMWLGLWSPFGLAAEITVCASGCDSTSIQGAITMATPGDEVFVLTFSDHTEGDIIVVKSVDIHGLPGQLTRVQADIQFNPSNPLVFHVLPGVTATFRDLHIRYGASGGSSCGGGIFNQGDLTLDHVLVSDNKSNLNGGGICNEGNLRCDDCEVKLNQASNYGGGVYNSGAGVVQAFDCRWRSNSAQNRGGNAFSLGAMALTRCSVENGSSKFGGGLYLQGSGPAGPLSAQLRSVSLVSNQAQNWGGGILADGAVVDARRLVMAFNFANLGGGLYQEGATKTDISDALFQGNVATGDGGGLFNDSSVSPKLSNVTFSGNRADNHGGGIYVYGQRRVKLASVSIIGNVADADDNDSGDGGGIFMGDQCSTMFCGITTVELRNSILGLNQDDTFGADQTDDCVGQLVSEGYNMLDEVGTGLHPCEVTGDMTGVLFGAPFVQVLADHGGPPMPLIPLLTHALIGGAQAIDAGNPAGCTTPNDVPLPADQRGALRVGRCDLGAFEFAGVVANDLISFSGFENGETAF